MATWGALAGMIIIFLEATLALATRRRGVALFCPLGLEEVLAMLLGREELMPDNLDSELVRDTAVEADRGVIE